MARTKPFDPARDDNPFAALTEDEIAALQRSQAAAATNGHAAGSDLPDRFFDPLPDTLYDLLPPFFDRFLQHITDPVERDLFVLATLPVLAGFMPRTLLHYGGFWQGLNLYLCIVGEAASGKGKARLARLIGQPLDETLQDLSRQAITAWHDQAKDKANPPTGPCPPFRRFFAGGDASGAAIKDALRDNPHLVIFETEIRSLSQALAQEWGMFRDVMLKGFHSEPIMVERKGLFPAYIPSPALSMCLTGTPGTFEGIISDTEDGLFSRTLFYYFEASTPFQNMFESKRSTALDTEIDLAAHHLPALYALLTNRAEPLYVRLDQPEQDLVVAIGSTLMEILQRGGYDPALQANIKRAALSAFRIGGILTLLDLFEQGAALGTVKSVTVRPEYLWAGLLIVGVLLDHAVRISDYLMVLSAKKEDNSYAFFARLPAGEFTSADAYAVAATLKIPQRSARYYLRRYVDRNLLEQAGRGRYLKRALHGNEEGFAQGITPMVAFVITEAQTPVESTGDVPDETP